MPLSTSSQFKYDYDATFTSLGEDVTGSSVVRSSLLASLVACLMASLYGPRFFLLYRVCTSDETKKYTGCHKKCFTDYTSIPPKHFIDKSELQIWEMYTEHGEQHFEQLLWLLLVTFYWWFVVNKVKFPRNVSINLVQCPAVWSERGD
jgi:hypothetical protein